MYPAETKNTKIPHNTAMKIIVFVTTLNTSLHKNVITNPTKIPSSSPYTSTYDLNAWLKQYKQIKKIP